MSRAKTTVKPPVVTIMGHVDHGKTTLLDYLRQSRIAAKESGGITQHIGAYQVEYQDKPITFIDTPGHAAFANMRAHGAALTDIVVLVVAADDGVKPQTKEAIKLIKAGELPCVVAINKIDLAEANPEVVKGQLAENEIFVEGYGGDVPVVEISALKGSNVDLLLETIQLVAEMEELTADPQASLEATVLESSLDKRQGAVATLVIAQGTLKLNDEIVAQVGDQQYQAKVKRLMSDTGKHLKQALPGQPVEIIGLKDVPPAGSVFTTTDNLEALQATLGERLARVVETADPDSEKINLILLADTQGSLEAIQSNLKPEVQVVHAATGQVTESDVLMAHTTGSLIVAFQTQVANSARKLAEIEQVEISEYQIIYKLLENLDKQVRRMLEPTIDETELGKAKVKAVFEMRGQIIAGCEVTSGAVSLKDKVHIYRGDNRVHDGRITSIKQGKVDVGKVEKGTECGIIIKPAFEVENGDIIQAYSEPEN